MKEVLAVVNDQLEQIGINYEFGRMSKSPPDYPYWVGDYTEPEGMTEDGTMIPLKFAKQGIVSTAAGILNSVAYIGCALMNRIAGGILQSGTWNTVIVFWIALAVGAIIFCLIPQRKYA